MLNEVKFSTLNEAMDKIKVGNLISYKKNNIYEYIIVLTPPFCSNFKILGDNILIRGIVFNYYDLEAKILRQKIILDTENLNYYSLYI